MAPDPTAFGTQDIPSSFIRHEFHHGAEEKYSPDCDSRGIPEHLSGVHARGKRSAPDYEQLDRVRSPAGSRTFAPCLQVFGWSDRVSGPRSPRACQPAFLLARSGEHTASFRLDRHLEPPSCLASGDHSLPARLDVGSTFSSWRGKTEARAILGADLSSSLFPGDALARCDHLV